MTVKIFLLQLTQFVRNEGSRKENEELSKIVTALFIYNERGMEKVGK